jgi:hypothetical protein
MWGPYISHPESKNNIQGDRRHGYVGTSVIKSGRIGSKRVTVGRRVLTGRVNGLRRDGLPRVYFGGFDHDPS